MSQKKSHLVKKKKTITPKLQKIKRNKKKKKKKKRQRQCLRKKKGGNWQRDYPKKKREQRYWQRYCPKKKGNVTAQGKVKKKKKLEENMGIFVNQEKIHLSSVFSPFQRENILVGLRRKHLGPTTYFPSSLSNQTHTKKVFFPIFFSIFSPKFFIYPISPPNKHTLRERHWAQGCSQASFDGWEGVMGINYFRLSCRWIRLLLQKILLLCFGCV